MTCAHVRLLGPCFKTGRVDYRPLATDPERRIADLPRPQRQVAEHRQAVHCVQNATMEPAASPRRAGASVLLSSADRRAIHWQAITPLRHPRVTRGETFPPAFSPSTSRSWRSPTERAHPPSSLRPTGPRNRWASRVGPSGGH